LLEAALEAYPSERRMTHGYADLKSSTWPCLRHLVASSRTCSRIATAIAYRARRGIRTGDRVVEEREDRIAGKALERRLELEDERAEDRVVLAEHAHHFLVPEDEICFFVFDAPSGRAAALVAERAELDPLRVVEAISSGREESRSKPSRATSTMT
jgi:hypothetical protein